MKSRALLGLLAAFAVLSAACSGDTAAETDAPTAAAETPDAAETAAATEAAGPTAASDPTAAADAATEAVAEGAPAGGDDLSGVEGAIVVSGSSTVQPITQAVAEEFNALQPDVATTVDGPGTGDGFELFCSGQTDLSDASRPIKEEEVAACEEAGIEFIELKVAIDGLSVLTSAENTDVTCLSFGDLYALIGPESTGLASWSDADELAAELDGAFGVSAAPFPEAPLVITGPGEESGTFDSFVEIVFGDIAEERGQAETTRPDYQASPNDNVIIEGVAGNPSSLGWVGYAFAEEAGDSVALLEIDGGDGCVAATPETISSGEYPIARDLYVYVNAGRLESNPALRPFVDYYVSDEGLANVAEVGYVDLAPESVQATRDAWEAGTTGVNLSAA